MNRIKLTGLWEDTDNNGNRRLSGSLNNCRVEILKNSFKKEGDNQPDYVLYFVDKRKKDEEIQTN